ncbi:hypothetical protein CK203_095679 [Vitis vinifera]|uniref:Retrotransposon Copia-like N-terminal domain-containing protein n=1 Tax=Vitis vinifera TaxID=29760 RepID=A0A438F0B5_VITVI|nr:hypothetical protein CK203_095679 [Vitis vinifera]
MTNDKLESSSVPIIHVQSENPSFTTNVILIETNYDVWSQIMEMHIAGCEKLEYRTSKTSLKVTNTSYAKWYAENQMVKGWLLTSMSPEIMKRNLRLHIAHEIWIALAKAFYDEADELQLFALNQRAFSTKQTNYHAFVVVIEPNHVSTSNPKKASSFIATSRNVGKDLHTSTPGENRDEVQTLHHPLDNLDFIRGDNLETSGECPSDDNTMDNEECPGDGPEFFDDENQGQMEEALKDPRWRKTMNEEMKALQKNLMWEVVNLLKGRYLLDVGGSSP